MKIDIPTLIIIIGLTHVMQVLVFFYQFRVNKSYKGPGWWLLWSAAEVVGFIAMLFRGNPSLLPVVIIVQNSMIVAGTVFLYTGVRRFLDKPVNLKLILPVVVAFFTGLLFFLFVNNEIQIRSSIISATLAVISLFTAQSLFASKSHVLKTTTRFNAIVFLVHSGIFFYHSVMLLTMGPEENFFIPTFFNIIPYFDALIVSLLWTFGFIIMLNQRLNAGLSEAEKILKHSETKLRSVLDATPFPVAIVDLQDDRISYWSQSATVLFGYTAPTVGEWYKIAYPDPVYRKEAIERWKPALEKAKQSGQTVNTGEYRITCHDGSVRICELYITFLEDSRIVTFHDITERKAEESRLKESEHTKSMLLEKLNEAQKIAMIGSWEWDLQTNRIWWSDECYRIFGVLPQEFTPGFEANGKFIHPDDREKYESSFQQSFETGNLLDSNFRLVTNDGTLKHIQAKGKLSYDDKGQAIFFSGTVMDITINKRAEEKILKANRVYAVISQINKAIVHLKDKNELFAEVCRIAVDVGKFQFSWIGLIDSISEKLHPVSFAGREDGYLSHLGNISARDVPEGHGPTGNAIREGRHHVSEDIENDPGMIPWKEEALKRGYRSSISLPVKVSDKVIGAFSIYSGTPLFFDTEEIELLYEVATDIGFALEVFETEDKRKQAETALIESENRYRRLHESMTDCFVAVTMSGEVVDFNRSYLDLLGYTPEELGSLQYKDITPEKWHIAEQGIVEKQILVHGASDVYEKEYFRKDGTVIPVELRTYLLRDDMGNPSGMWAIVRDITERQLATEALYESEQKFRSLIGNIKIGVVLHGPDTGIIFSNPMASELLGLTSDQMQGKTAIDPAWCFIREDGTRAPVDEYPVNRALTSDKVLSDLILGIMRPDRSSLTWVQCSSHAIYKPDGQLQQVVVTFFDITGRIAAEEALRLKNRVFDASIAANSISDLNGVLTEVNDTFLRVWGYPSRETVIGKSLVQFINNSDDAFAIVTALNETGQWEGDYEAKRMDGAVFIAHGLATIVKDKNNKVIGYQAAVIDITDRKHAEEEIKKLNETLEQRVIQRTGQLEAANQELEAFTYSVSHDLRAPLRHIGGYVDLLAKRYHGSLPEQGLHYLDTIVDSANQMGTLIDDLLKFSRTSRQEMNETDVDMGSLMEEVLEKLKGDYAGRNIEWIIAELPHVMADQQLMHLVWMNLLSNAIKFTRARKTARIEIGFTREKAEVVFIVRDNGAGFDMQYAQKLFGVFQRLHASEEFEGTGIGLANVKRIIVRHGGRTWADAKPDKGATFYFSLPLAKT